MITASAVPSRLFASEPMYGGPSVEVFERDGLGATHHCWSVDSDASIERLLESIAASPLGTLGVVGTDTQDPTSGDRVTRPTFLVCTQGSHDWCCGTFGTALVETIISTRPDYDVRGISHTGGHRFAPTLLAIPSGRMWAFADMDLIDRAATGSETRADLLERCRGWWGAGVGVAQVAECVARAFNGRGFGSAPQVLTTPGEAGGAECVVISQDGEIPVTVQVAREVPTIACEAPGGLPAKLEREFVGFVGVVEASGA